MDNTTDISIKGKATFIKPAKLIGAPLFSAMPITTTSAAPAKATTVRWIFSEMITA